MKKCSTGLRKLMWCLRCLIFITEDCLVIEVMRRLTQRFTVFGFSPFLFTGFNCQVNIDECASNPCLNQGTCFDDISGYTCQCVLPYTGETCRCRGQGRCLVLPYCAKHLSFRVMACGSRCCSKEIHPGHPSCPHWLGCELWENTVASLDASGGETHLPSLYFRVWNFLFSSIL